MNSFRASSRPQCRCGCFNEELGVFEEMRIKNQLCDGVVICADSTKFHLHRIVLAVVSPYFKALFTNSINRGGDDVRETHVSETGEVFQVILRWAYSKQFTLDEANVFDVFECADKYEIMDVVDKCCLEIVQNLSGKMCLDIMKFARQFSCNDLYEKARLFALHHFNDVLRSDEYVKLSGPQLKDLLQDDALNVASEDVVFDAIKQWINFDPLNRRGHMYELIKCIRVGNIESINFLDLSRFLIQCHQEGVFMDLENIEPLALGCCLTKPRLPYHLVFAIGGWNELGAMSCLEAFNNKANKWSLIPDSGKLRAYHGLCLFHNNIYVIGGYNGQEAFDTVQYYNPVSHTWHNCARMLYIRCHLNALVCHDRIYAIGGFDGIDRHSSGERYDNELDQWDCIAPMRHARSDAGACVLADKIYIAGGCDGERILRHVEMFDASTNQWTEVKPMTYDRAGLSLITYNSKIYALGGYNNFVRMSTGEKYDIDNDQWHEVMPMNNTRSNFGAVVLEGRICVLGGFNGAKSINLMECFDEMGGRWVDGPCSMVNRSAFGLCLISGLGNVRDYIDDDEDCIDDVDLI